mmetsp:Transcript_8734/g.10608  ORF Transcript_8734/g.10608 Transcript_8734/m.10608 type:complete len:290 (-) Transcript_8734:168-1037(-)
MSLCEICNLHPKDTDGFCTGCRASRRLLTQIAEIPPDLRKWGIDKVRIVSSEIADEVDRLRVQKKKEAEAVAANPPSPGRSTREKAKEVKEEQENEEQPVAEAKESGGEEKKVEEPAKEETKSKRRSPSGGEKVKKRKEKRKRGEDQSRAGSSSAKPAGKQKEKKRRDQSEEKPAVEEKRSTTPRYRESEKKEKKDRPKESRSKEREEDERPAPSSHTGVRLASKSPDRGRERPREPSVPPRWARHPSPPPGKWESQWYHWERDRTPPRWKNKGRTKVYKQQVRREQGW